jgi:hypothetical protein
MRHLGETRHCKEIELEIVVRGFPLVAPCQTLRDQQEVSHVALEVRQRRQGSRKGFPELIDVVTGRDTMLSNHDIHYLARSQSVGFDGRVGRFE